MPVTGGTQGVQSLTHANLVDTAVLTGAGFSVKVTNLSENAHLFWTVDSPGGACVPPTVNGVNSFCASSVGAGAGVNTRAGDFMYGAVVQLISAASVQYMVELQSIRATS